MSESQQPMKMESYLPIRFFEKQQTNKKTPLNTTSVHF